MSECQNCGGGGCAIAAPPPPQARKSIRPYVVAIIGPPNSGKSTLFNRLTGLRQKVANFPGVTVEQRVGKAKMHTGEREVTLVDLPGVYSLNPRSEDEQVTHDVLKGLMKDVPKPDSVLLILDSTNLGRHLVLAAPILSLKLPTLVILNMADDLSSRGGTVDTAELASELGAPVALISAAKGEGVDKVFQFMAGTSAGTTLAPARVELPVLQDIPRCRQWAQEVGIGAAYQAPCPPKWTRRLDAIFLHPIAGPLIFIAVVAGVFQTIFRTAKPVTDGLQALFQTSGHWVGSLIPNGILQSLIVDGVWRGVGSVLVFIPQILLLFLFIGILEDSGYLARAALIADRTMAKFGLQGKSFIPLLSAYGCAVPAIMATRTIESKRDRLATILIAPFMTCSARLPVYFLIIAAFIKERPVLGPFLGTQAAALLGLYVLGFLAAIITARLLKSSILKSERTPFMLEMPPYRMPTLRSLALRLYDRSKIFLRRAGTVILAVAIVLWVLCYLPFKDGKPPEITDSFAGAVGHFVEPVIKPLGFNWKIGIGLLSSIFAREVMVGTLGMIYGMEGTEDSVGLQKALQSELTTGGAFALLVFFAFAMQCISTIAVVRRETGGWKWPAIQFGYMTFVAYTCAVITNQVVKSGLFG